MPWKMVAGILLAAALALHWRVAELRGRALLEHDESIALLEAAGKAAQAEALFQPAGQVSVFSASEIQDLLRPGRQTSLRDVTGSLASFDIHPPLYFCSLLELQRLGPDSQIPLRLFGTFLFFLTAWIADRWIWPEAPPSARVLAAAWLLLGPVCMGVATELRQYGFVFLGVALSLAGLLRFQSAPGLRRAWLMAAGPIVLLYSHFGTAIWISVLLVIAVFGARHSRMHLLALGQAVLIATLVSIPLLIWWAQKSSRLGGSSTIHPSQWWGLAIEPLMRSLADAWVSLPGHWMVPIAWALIGITVIGVILRAGLTSDRALSFAITLWTLLWLFLVIAGRVPPHAMTPKYLGPLILGSLAIVTRATARDSRRRLALAALAISVTSHVLLVGRMLQRSQDPSVQAIAASDYFVVSNPRRGYLLPIAEKMKPQARVAIAGQNAWPQLAPQLPQAGVLLLEIGGRANDVREGLSQRFGRAQILRDEPARTITAYQAK